jgi:undecaprenyl-diphosphatase
MTYVQAIILGFLQGIAEFLPISSSGHLVLLPSILGWDIPADQAFAFNVLLQAATLLAVLSFFFLDLFKIFSAVLMAVKQKSLSDSNAQLGLFTILATIPASVVGLALNGLIEKFYNNPQATSIFLIGTAAFLIIAEKAGKRDRGIEDLTWKDAFWVGVFQIFALFPGISRSGVTITGGMLRNLDRTSSARFSFLISVPLLVAAGANGLYKFILLPETTSSLPVFLVGSVTAAIVGYISIKWLLNFLKNRSLYTFAIYCVVFALFNLLIFSIR